MHSFQMELFHDEWPQPSVNAIDISPADVFKNAVNTFNITQDNYGIHTSTQKVKTN